jgi:photosystem II stability/assembly factor-like uncharacterized protein
MKTKIIVFALIVFCFSSFRQNAALAQSVWSQQIISPLNGGVGYYSSIKFVNSLTGWASGYSNNDPNTDYGVLMKTSNGGNTWTWVDLGLTTQYRIGIFFLNENTGWIWTYAGQMKKTTNGGNTWIDQSFGGTGLFSVTFVNDQTGYATGTASTDKIIRKTTNGGTDWITISTGTVQWNKIKFTNTLTGWVSGNSGSNYYVSKTTNGGINWTQLLSESNTDFFFLNALTGWVTVPGTISTPAVIKKTINGGGNWSSISFSSVPNTSINTIKFMDENTGWCSSDKGIYLSTNGGVNWISQYVLAGSGGIYDFDFAGRDSGWASSQNRLLKTVNGNAISVTQISSYTPAKFSLKQNYPNPFNPATKISFNIKNATFASLKVFDMTGKEVKNLVNENVGAGSYEIDFDGSDLNSGVYFYTLKTNEFTETKKMMLVK